MRRSWTAEDDTLLRDCAATTPHEEIAAALGRSVQSVRHRASRLGIPGRTHAVRVRERIAEDRSRGCYVPPVAYRTYEAAWSEGDVGFLVGNYSEMTASDIATALGRTTTAVKSKASELGLKKGYQSGDKHAAWKGGKKHHNTHWKNVVRPQVLERDGWMCQTPGCRVVDFSGSALRAHHIIPFRFTQDDALENHITLCQPCHAKQEAHWWSDATYEAVCSLPSFQLRVLRTAP